MVASLFAPARLAFATSFAATVVVAIQVHTDLRNTAAPGIASNQLPLKVAFAVFVTDVGSSEWEDALRVLAYSVKKAALKSRHSAHLVALSPMRLSTEKERLLKTFGFEEVLRRDVPVPAARIQNPETRQEMEHVMGRAGLNEFRLEEETIKYWGIAMTDYDRVLIIDGDTMVLDPMDELMEASADLLGVYDHGLDSSSSKLPPIQGGFLLVRPSEQDFNEIKRLTEEGDWRGGEGWKGSRIGYCYGGVGPDGLLSYYYNKDGLNNVQKKINLHEGLEKPRVLGSRMHAVDRSVYDLVINKRLMSDLETADKLKTVASVKSVHFTGDCVKPWTCFEPRDWLCEGVFKKWWELRSEAERAAQLPPTPNGCVNGIYVPMARNASL